MPAHKLKYAFTCKSCMRTATMSVQPIPGSQASAPLMARVMSSTFHDGLPLYRQEQMAKREGLDLERSKLARWTIEGAKVFKWHQLVILRLNETQLEELVARLAEAEVSAASQSAAYVSWSGSINAPDEGVDIQLNVPDKNYGTGFLARPNTIFQAKKHSILSVATKTVSTRNKSL